MLKNKKILATLWPCLSSILISPIFVISCGEKVKKSQNGMQDIAGEKYKLKKFEPFDFNDIGKDEPIFLGGVQYTAYSQGFSFLLNIAKKLGWNYEDSDLMSKLHDPNFDWDTIDVTNSKSKSKFNKNHTKITDFEKILPKKLILVKKYKDNKGKEKEQKHLKTLGYLMKRNSIIPKTHLWYVINNLIWLDPNDREIISNVDASTEKVIDLGNDFQNLNDIQKLKRVLNNLNNNSSVIFPHLKYAYNLLGLEVTKLAFQISNNKLLIWHYLGKEATRNISLSNVKLKKQKIIDVNKGIEREIHSSQDFQNKHFPENYSIQKSKNLSQIWLDPIGADGTLSRLPFITTVNTKIDPNFKLSNYNTRNDVYKYLKSLNLYSGKGMWKLNNSELTTLVTYNSFINADNPGEVILKIFTGEESVFQYYNIIHYGLKKIVSPNIMQKFKIINDKNKIDELIDLIWTFFKRFQHNSHVKNNKSAIKMLLGKTSPIISSFINFIKYYDFKRNDIERAFKSINNGSHYMLGLEIFLRGIKNIPREQTKFKFKAGIELGLKILKIKYKKIDNVLEGMASTGNIINLINYLYNIDKMKLARNFNPKTQMIVPEKPYTKPWQRHKYFLEDN